MCIFRDWSFCLILSVAFETVELSFQWLVPELRVTVQHPLFDLFGLANVTISIFFRRVGTVKTQCERGQECWWDSIFLDVLLSNMVGMAAGYTLLRVFRSVTYNWLDVTLKEDEERKPV